MSRKERLLSIIQSLDKYHYQYGGIHLVVIDGIADLIKCANDEAESIAVVEELYRLFEEFMDRWWKKHRRVAYGK